MSAIAPPVAATLEAESGARAIGVERLGVTEYVDAWRAMQAFTGSRDRATPDAIWLTEHPPVYTLGLAGRREHVREPADIPVLKVDRGGQVTYHGPGQTVAYVLVDLARRRLGVRALVRAIEGAVIELLAGYDVRAYGRADRPGVYIERGGREAKIAALGLKIRNGCSYHGVALNRDMDLTPFTRIDPCGFAGLEVAQLRDLAPQATREDVESRFAAALATSIDRASREARLARTS